jgi:chemotaxis protein methyltransferase CheR
MASIPDNHSIQKLIQLAHELTGVQLTDRHAEMITARLQRRLAQLNLGSLREYLDYFYGHRTEESEKLIGYLTTHHTAFFREFAQFEFLLSDALPQLIPIVTAQNARKIRIWSAACSHGQEVYSLAMFFDLHLKRLAPQLDYEILGTDVDKQSIAIAENGVYLRKELQEAPLSLLGNHWAEGTGEISTFVKAKSSLRNHCRFQVRSLIDLDLNVAPDQKFDLIFCRNVFIYFNSEQIKNISARLLQCLKPDGYLLVGASESLNGLKLPLKSAGSSIYRHANDHPAQPSVPVPVKPDLSARLIRILCVDDSPTILGLLKKILTSQFGFEVVGTASNGAEAKHQVELLKPDAVTLDIHMPVQSGIEYLEHNYRPNHPPVLMLSSVVREDQDLADKALRLGAADYAEKPALVNLFETGEEIRAKLSSAVLASRVRTIPKGQISLPVSAIKASSKPGKKVA